MGKFDSEKETHISMCKTSDMMEIYTTEQHVMRKLDKYVQESDDWKVLEISRRKGEIVAKTYEAPRKFLMLRKHMPDISDEQRQAASERLKAYQESQKNKPKEVVTATANNNESAFIPERSKPKYVKVEMFEPVK